MSHSRAKKRTKGDDRRKGSQDKRSKLLIVCEGTKTEPNYFNDLIEFHQISQVRIEVIGTGRNTLSLVEHAETLQGTGTNRYVEIWCVFDCDSFPNANFDNAIHKCTGTIDKPHPFLRAAWSNESFELWFLLHLQDLQTSPVRGGHGRARVYYMEQLKKSSEQFDGDAYEKNLPNMYVLLLEYRDLAATRAEKLLAKCDAATPYHDRKPATTVHHLVKRLLEYAPENQPI